MLNRFRKISSFLNTAGATDREDFIKNLKGSVKALFPKSLVEVTYNHRLGKDISLTVALGNEGEWTNGIIQNDPLLQTVFFEAVHPEEYTDDGGLPSLMRAENSRGSLKVAPAQGSRFAFDVIKLGWKNKTDNPQNILKYVVNYFRKTKQVIQDNLDRLPERLKNKV